MAVLWPPCAGASSFGSKKQEAGLHSLCGGTKIANARGASYHLATMDRELLIVSTLCFFLAMVRTALSVRARNYQSAGFNFFAIALGFVFQTAFLSVRGHAIGRCPLTNLFEVFIFLAWSVSLIYLLIGPAYRLSLMGAFTAPLVFGLQIMALLAPIDRPHPMASSPSPWLELHASVSLIAYGAFALACVAGLMYLGQERQLKRRQINSMFYHFPPLTDLFAAITRLLWLGFILLTVGIVTGFFTGQPLPYVKIAWSLGVWIFYAAILFARHLGTTAPRLIATLCVVAFSAALTLLWGITFLSPNHSL
jgi:HemX protein